MSNTTTLACGDVAGVAVTDTPDGLQAIRDAATAAAIWRRQPLAGFREWIDGLSPDTLPTARVILRPASVRDAVTQLCDAAGMPPGPERARLIDDIAALADLFAGVMQTPFLRLRLDVVQGNACRKFHVDAITARLVCTYRGTGTQYGIGAAGADPARIFTVPTGAPSCCAARCGLSTRPRACATARRLSRAPARRGWCWSSTRSPTRRRRSDATPQPRPHEPQAQPPARRPDARLRQPAAQPARMAGRRRAAVEPAHRAARLHARLCPHRDESHAIAALDRLQQQLVARDAARVWGVAHPDAAGAQPGSSRPS